MAVVKKVAVKNVAVKKVDGKKVAKPVVAVKKPVAKKPNVGTKFNLHKLIMLIIRDAPKAKKGNKMTGGYDKKSVDNILNIILQFLNTKKIRDRIAKLIEDVYAVGNHSRPIINYKDETIQLLRNDINISNVKLLLGRMMEGSSFADELKVSLKYDEANISKFEKDKRFHNYEFINIVIVLCNIYINYYNNADDVADIDKIKVIQVQ